MQSDEMSSEEEHSIPTLTVEEATSTFQEVFRYIKEATGATDLQVELRGCCNCMCVHVHSCMRLCM